jgi:ribosomal protein S27E
MPAVDYSYLSASGYAVRLPIRSWQGLYAPAPYPSCCHIVGGREVNGVRRILGYLLLGLFGVVLFVFGGSLVIWALHILMWNAPSENFIDHLPSDTAALYLIATPLGLFLIGFGLLLIVWGGAGLSGSAQSVLIMHENRKKETEDKAAVRARCPRCNATYVYPFSDAEESRIVTCQNCGRQFEAVKSPDGNGANG